MMKLALDELGSKVAPQEDSNITVPAITFNIIIPEFLLCITGSHQDEDESL